MATKPPKPAHAVGANGPPATSGEVLTLAEAAALLRVSEEGLKADAVAGRVPGRPVAGEWRFTRTALLTWLSQPEPAAGKSSKERMLSAFGAWKDFGEDPEQVIAELSRARKATAANEG